MQHYSEDVLALLRRSPWLTLARARTALPFLVRRVEAGEECRAALRSYPRIQIEPLEFHYTCARNLAALDEPFVETLIADFGWRGAVWASWLALLEPRAELGPALRAAAGRYPENDWLVRCAIDAVTGRPPSADAREFLVVANAFGRQVSGTARLRTPLRPAPTPSQLVRMQAEREHIRSVYRRLGADAARAASAGTSCRYYALEYPEWLKLGAPPPPGLDGPRA